MEAIRGVFDPSENSGQHIPKLALTHGFDEKTRKADLLESCAVAALTKGCDHDEMSRCKLLIGFYATAKGFPVHAGHVHVEKRDRVRLSSAHGLTQLKKRRLSILCLCRRATPRTKQYRQESAVRLMIVDYKNSRPWKPLSPGQGLRAGVFIENDGEPEKGTIALLGFNPYPTTHQLGKLSRYGQAEPGAGIFAGCGAVHLCKRRKQGGYFILRDADARVTDFTPEL